MQVRLAHFQALINLYKALGGGWTLPALDRNHMKLGRVILLLVLLGAAGAAGWYHWVHAPATGQQQTQNGRGRRPRPGSAGG